MSASLSDIFNLPSVDVGIYLFAPLKEAEFASDSEKFDDQLNEVACALAVKIAHQTLLFLKCQLGKKHGLIPVAQEPLEFLYSLDITDSATAEKIAGFLQGGKHLFAEWCLNFTPQKDKSALVFTPRMDRKFFQDKAATLCPHVKEKLQTILDAYRASATHHENLHLEVVRDTTKNPNCATTLKVIAYVEEKALPSFMKEQLAKKTQEALASTK